MTPTQKSIKDRLLSIKSDPLLKREEMIGRKLFLAIEFGTNVFTQEQYIGTIGPRGQIDFDRYVFGGKFHYTDVNLLTRS